MEQSVSSKRSRNRLTLAGDLEGTSAPIASAQAARAPEKCKEITRKDPHSARPSPTLQTTAPGVAIARIMTLFK
jgi:hypothetical protein